MSKVTQVRLAVGGAALVLGVAVYVIDRPATAGLIPSIVSLHSAGPPVFGHLGRSLPSFLHAFAFCLFIAAVLDVGRAGAVGICLGWSAVEVAFELGQHPRVAPWLAGSLPSWFERIPLLDRTAGYFLRGTFDPHDVMAIAAGGIGAWVVIELTRHLESNAQPS